MRDLGANVGFWFAEHSLPICARYRDCIRLVELNRKHRIEHGHVHRPEQQHSLDQEHAQIRVLLPAWTSGGLRVGVGQISRVTLFLSNQGAASAALFIFSQVWLQPEVKFQLELTIPKNKLL